MLSGTYRHITFLLNDLFMIPWKIIPFKQLASTNSELAVYADNGVDEGLVIWALEQKEGRGRFCRNWFSPLDGLYFSILLKPTIDEKYLNLISFTIGIAIVDCLKKETDLVAYLKWPNDIIIDGKKAGGILIESKFQGVRLIHLIAGIGLNINQDIKQFPEVIQNKSTSLYIESGKKFDIETFINSLLSSIDKWYGCLESKEYEKIMDVYRAKSSFIGKKIRFENERIFSGVVTGISDRGSLKLMTDGGEKEFYNGSVVEIFAD
jgi:BirA family transcriptional regulator, biotin operon repressor / biotin---[acetyl-CoA-carboxylase] ligase